MSKDNLAAVFFVLKEQQAAIAMYVSSSVHTLCNTQNKEVGWVRVFSHILKVSLYSSIPFIPPPKNL